MFNKIIPNLVLIIALTLGSCNIDKREKSFGQNPSPMEEFIRPHNRVSSDNCEGKRVTWEIEGKSVQMFVPTSLESNSGIHLILHFHGSSKVSEFAVCDKKSQVMVAISGGSGSSSYKKMFINKTNFTSLLSNIQEKLGAIHIDSITLSGWSAGYGAIREILETHENIIDQVLLLDGMHASYAPEGKSRYQGGEIDSVDMANFLQYAEKAIRLEKKMVITHSFIFPGTYASTTECTQYLLDTLNLKRTPVLKHGPMGMQQLSETISGNLQILSYAGNSAPDHVDHLHGLGYFLNRMFVE